MMRYLWLALLSCGMLLAAEEMEVVKNMVNVREKASAKARIVGKLKKGERVQVKAVKAGWAELADQKGFVAASLLGKPSAGKASAEGNKVSPAKKADGVAVPSKKTGSVSVPSGKPDNPFSDIPVVPKSGRDVTVKGMLYPIKGKGAIGYALLTPVAGKYQILCYVYVYKKEAPKFLPLANKDVQLVGTWYKVRDWKKPVLQVRSIKEL